jgi:hypothetical protein
VNNRVKKYIMPISSQADKQEIAEKVKEYLKKHKEVDLRIFMSNMLQWGDMNHGLVSEIANILRQTGEYEMSEGGMADITTYFIRPVKRKPFNEREPIWFAIIMAVLGAGLALGGKLLSEIPAKQSQHQLDQRQDSTLQLLADSINILETALQDSIKSVRLDTTLVNK